MPFARLNLLLTPAFVAFFVAAAPAARAAPSAADRSMAQSLFEDARRLMTAKDYAAACPKFEESNRLDPSGGTVLNLALCREQEGKLATARTHFKQALSAAKRDERPDRVQAAETHLSALESRVPSITIEVVTPRPDQEVLVDGAMVGRAAWGTRMLLDPGSHEISSHAPGTPAWSQSVQLEPGSNIKVEVPLLVAPSTTAPAAAPVEGEKQPTSAEASGGTSTLGWVIGGAGVAALGVGTVFGIQALSKQQKSEDECPTTKTCSDQGVAYGDQANTAAWVANIGIGLGLVGVVTGTYLILSSSGAKPAQARTGSPVLRLGAGPSSGRVSLEGTW